MTHKVEIFATNSNVRNLNTTACYSAVEKYMSKNLLIFLFIHFLFLLFCLFFNTFKQSWKFFISLDVSFVSLFMLWFPVSIRRLQICLNIVHVKYKGSKEIKKYKIIIRYHNYTYLYERFHKSVFLSQIHEGFFLPLNQ